jgi:hypothetical protein
LHPARLSQSASLLGQSRTGFSLMELILTIVLTHLVSCLAPTTFAGRLPQPTRLPIARSRGFHPASGTTRPSDDSPGIAHHFAFRLIGSLIPVPPGNRTSPPGVTS